MAVTFFEEGVEQGIERGIERGKREAIKLILEDRFGVLSKQIVSLIDSWPEKTFRKLMRLATQAESLNELKAAAKQK